MKLLTLNTHSLAEEDAPIKAKILADAIIKEKADVIALQEVNQTINEEICTCPDITGKVKKDNFLLEVIKNINASQNYHGVWMPIKKGYGKFDEGIALLSKLEIIETKDFYVSHSEDYNNWKTRRIVGIKTNKGWFFSVHFGFWNDEDSFLSQWERLCAQLPENEKIWLMGDFNSPSHIKGEGYEHILNSNWYDSFALAKEKDDGATVDSSIDGWEKSEEKKRIDYIFSNFKADVKSSFTIFNGKREKKISDHNGVVIETEA